MQDDFAEERAVVLTLKDRGVLDENDDTLVNVNMLDDERYKKVCISILTFHLCPLFFLYEFLSLN